jgi:hypothetical protein
VAQAVMHPPLAKMLLADLPKSEAVARNYLSLLGQQIRGLALESSVRAQNRQPAPLPRR